MKIAINAWSAIVAASLSLISATAQAEGYGISNYVVSTSKNVDWIPQYKYDACNVLAAGLSTSACNTATAYAMTSSVLELGTASGSAYAWAPGSGPNGGIGGTVSTVDSYWWDTITITSATLAPGTVVTVNGKVDLTASVVPSRLYPSPYTRAQALLTWGGPDCCGVATARSDTVLSSAGSFLALVGGSYSIYGKFMITTGTSAHDPLSDVGSVNATARYTLWVDTPGAGYSTASGINYAPVPEPSGMAMMLVGLGLLGFMARKRMQS